MLLHDSRHAARTSRTGDLVLLDDQDRSLWKRDQIMEGLSLLQRARSSGRVGPYTIQARLSAAERQLKQVESQLRLLQVRLDDTTITAPFDGYVVERYVEPSEWVRARGQLMPFFNFQPNYSHLKWEFG